MEVEEEQGLQLIDKQWLVIGSFFKEKGLVFNQIDSFNNFTSVTIQQHIQDHSAIEITPQEQFIPGDTTNTKV